MKQKGEGLTSKQTEHVLGKQCCLSGCSFSSHAQPCFLVGESLLIIAGPPPPPHLFNHSQHPTPVIQSSPVVAFWIVFICVRLNGTKTQENVWSACVCVRACACVGRPVFCRFQTEVWNHPGLTATQLWRSTPNTSQEFSAWVTRGR